MGVQLSAVELILQRSNWDTVIVASRQDLEGQSAVITKLNLIKTEIQNDFKLSN